MKATPFKITIVAQPSPANPESEEYTEEYLSNSYLWMFPAFGLNTERCEVSLRILSECGEMRTRITPNTDTLHAVKAAVALRVTSKKSFLRNQV